MPLDIGQTCEAASDNAGVGSLSLFLTVLFAVYIAVDSMLASAVIARKAAESESTTAMALRSHMARTRPADSGAESEDGDSVVSRANAIGVPMTNLKPL